MDVEVQGPHETQDGQLLIRLDLNRKEMLTLRLQNGGTQPITLTHVFPLSRTPQFKFYKGDQKLPCSLGPGEWVSKGMSLGWAGAGPREGWCLGTTLVLSCGSCLGLGPFGGVSRAQVLVGDPSPTPPPLTQPAPPGECYELLVHCQTSFVGYFPATVIWELLGPEEPGSKGAGTFYIARFLAAVAHSPLAAQLKPTAPFKRARITGNLLVTARVEEGQRPDR